MNTTEEARTGQVCGIGAGAQARGLSEGGKCERRVPISAQPPSKLTYDLDSITRNVPSVSGVFVIYSWDACVFVGESDDVCASLLEIYYEANPCLARNKLTHFTFELGPPDSRAGRQFECIQELGPACNLGQKSPECKDCRLRPWGGQGGMVRVAAPF